ncbi:uncharacterized protein LOC128993377 [Macrosteles quadrilineatus]|uniref:uncharacterized protein LOC128993377 n=1 Tax=Macrosteles quadrilineatus TaxID=74068 RepID=UPI0023E0EDA5|nr:uncharacterized protein LOC128993377 [Macrosteles quadrilineatus]
MSSSKNTKSRKPSSTKKHHSPPSSSQRGKNINTFKIDEFKSILIDDDLWQPLMLSVLVENKELNDKLLMQLNNLPANLTVITPNDLSTNEKETPNIGSTKNSQKRNRSTSASSRKSKRTGDTKVKNGVNQKENNDEADCGNPDLRYILCKKYILKLRNSDLENENKRNYIEMEMTNETKNREGRDFRSGEKTLFQRYVILWGFYDSNLIETFSDFNIPISAIIDIKEKPLPGTNETIPEMEKKPKKKQKPLNLQSSEEYSVFIERFKENIKDKTFLERYKDLLFLEYDTYTGDGKKSFPSSFFYLLNEINKAKGQYNHYKKCLKIQEIPEIQGTLTLDDVPLYSTMVSMVPLECITIPVIVHCMLEQVCWWDEHILHTANTCENIEVANISDVISSSSDTEKKSSHPSTNTIISENSFNIETTVKNITPTLIDHRDEITNITFHCHLPEIDFQTITMDMLLKSPVYNLWLKYPIASPSSLKWHDFHLQRFKKCAANCYFDVDSIFTFYLHQSIFNIFTSKKDKLSIKKGADVGLFNYEESDFHSNKRDEDMNVNQFVHGMLSNVLCQVSQRYSTNFSQSADSYSKSIESLENVSCYTDSMSSISPECYKRKTPEFLKGISSHDKIVNYRIKKLNKLKSFLFCSEFTDLYEDLKKYLDNDTDFTKTYEFVEYLKVNTMCQSLQNAYENFIDANYFYFPLTDTLLLWFNNSEDKDLTCSRKVKGVLETPLGFREFYKYKIGGRLNFDDLPNEDSVPSELNTNMSKSGDLSVNSEHTSSRESPKDNFPILSVANLGPFRIEHNEHIEHFCSPDSTKVMVKRTNSFFDKMNVAVSINKNNTSLSYSFVPQLFTPFVDVLIKFHNEIRGFISLTWCLDTQEERHLNSITSPQSKQTNCFSLNCDLSFTLPSGLLVEVVQTKSEFGPFYVRQRYLSKGLTCSRIWDETHRCYLNNGTILTFYSDGTVCILYSNGTTVNCLSFEWEKIVLEKVSPDENLLKGNSLKGQAKNNSKNTMTDKSTKKIGKGKTKVKKEGKKIPGFNMNEDSLNKANEDSMQEIYECKVTQHSVVSWDGSCEEFNQHLNKKSSKLHDVRMAFEPINQELYLQRTDGLSSLFKPYQLSVLFPDGSKITSLAYDDKEICENSNFATVGNFEKEYNRVDKIGNQTQSNGSESFADSLEEQNPSNDSKSQYNQDNLNEDSFVYVETSYTFEHTNYARVEFNNAEYRVRIALPGNILVHIEKNGLFTIESNENEKITMTDNNLIFEAQVLENSNKQSITTLYFNNASTIPVVSCQTVDSFCNVFSVSEKGYTSIVKSEDCKNCVFDLSDCTPLHPENFERYFVVKRDLSGYEMIRRLENNKSAQMIKTALVKNNDDLFTLYSQIPVFKNHSEKYLMSYVTENNQPTLIKRKDLLKLEEMPKIIWFYPHLSNIKMGNIDENILNNIHVISQKTIPSPVAMTIYKCLKIKNNFNVSCWFSKAIKQYKKIGEVKINQYFDHYPEEIKDEEVETEGELHKLHVLGSESYYLTDNVPEMSFDAFSDKDQISIYSVSE